MKKLMLVFMLVMTLSSRAFSDDIPPGVNYIKAPDETNMKAQKKVEQIFSQTRIKLDELFGATIVCGPSPWAQIKNMGVFRDLKILKADIVIPLRDGGQQRLEGAVFRTKEEISAFCRAMEDYLGAGGRYKIRRPNAEELQIYWAMIPYDISEPIFVAENSDHKLLMHFMNDTGSVFWIGDLQGIRMTRGTD